MTEKNNSNCPLTKLFSMLSRKHTLIIIHTLSKGYKGFNDLQESTSINTATLVKRLRELEEAKIIDKIVCPKDTRQRYYSLSERGKKISKLLTMF